MRRTMKNLPRLVIATLAALSLSEPPARAENFNGPEIRGSVTDVETGEPVAGAMVVWRWHGMKNLGWVDSQLTCYRMELAITDANGKFLFPAWNFSSANIPSLHDKYDSSATIYKPGYAKFLYGGYGADNSRTELKVKKMPADDDQAYLKAIWKIRGRINCTYSDYTMSEETIKGLGQMDLDMLGDVLRLKDSKEKEELIRNIQQTMNALDIAPNEKKSAK